MTLAGKRLLSLAAAGGCLLLVLVIPACGFLGFFGGNGLDVFAFSDVSLSYTYMGGTVISSGPPPAGPLVFWFMPLNDENEPITDQVTGEPERIEAVAYQPDGVLDVTLPHHSYYVLAFVDSVSRNRSPDLGEEYELYRDKYFFHADSEWVSIPDGGMQVEILLITLRIDTLYVDGDMSIAMNIEGNAYSDPEKAVWKAAHIVSPQEGGVLQSPHIAGGFFFGDAGSGGIERIRVLVDGGSALDQNATLNDEYDVWYVDDLKNLYSGTHTIQIEVYAGGMPSKPADISYKVTFQK